VQRQLRFSIRYVSIRSSTGAGTQPPAIMGRETFCIVAGVVVALMASLSMLLVCSPRHFKLKAPGFKNAKYWRRHSTYQSDPGSQAPATACRAVLVCLPAWHPGRTPLAAASCPRHNLPHQQIDGVITSIPVKPPYGLIPCLGAWHDFLLHIRELQRTS